VCGTDPNYLKWKYADLVTVDFKVGCCVMVTVDFFLVAAIILPRPPAWACRRALKARQERPRTGSAPLTPPLLRRTADTTTPSCLPPLSRLSQVRPGHDQHTREPKLEVFAAGPGNEDIDCSSQITLSDHHKQWVTRSLQTTFAGKGNQVRRVQCGECSECSECSGCSECGECSGCSGCSERSECGECSECGGCSECSGAAGAVGAVGAAGAVEQC
jgi:hypothetical protein